MKYSLLSFFLAFGIVSSTGAWAGSESAEVYEGPTQEEYEAALIIVQRYMLEEERRNALESTQDGVELDDTAEDSIPRVVTDAGLSVFGSGQVEAASITAFTADNNDGSLRVGNPDAFNQAKSGHLVFHENLNVSDFYWDDLCGFKFYHNGETNTLSLKGDCTLKTSIHKIQPLVVFDRDPGEPVMFNRTIGVGGKLFDGTGSGGDSGGGDLTLSWISNSALTCGDICQNHNMICSGALTLSGIGITSLTCGSTGSDLEWNLCMCSDDN